MTTQQWDETFLQSLLGKQIILGEPAAPAGRLLSYQKTVRSVDANQDGMPYLESYRLTVVKDRGGPAISRRLFSSMFIDAAPIPTRQEFLAETADFIRSAILDVVTTNPVMLNFVDTFDHIRLLQYNLSKVMTEFHSCVAEYQRMPIDGNDNENEVTL